MCERTSRSGCAWVAWPRCARWDGGHRFSQLQTCRGCAFLGQNRGKRRNLKGFPPTEPCGGVTRLIHDVRAVGRVGSQGPTPKEQPPRKLSGSRTGSV